ncbi:hypothetical protein, partial [Mesomycoplasma ovipneumoniae]|uniref:hypothetical protein n=1 Tax=Mesomycoplasma ovipneumoniae TaxID=29562 RepID=UPI003080043E
YITSLSSCNSCRVELTRADPVWLTGTVFAKLARFKLIVSVRLVKPGWPKTILAFKSRFASWIFLKSPLIVTFATALVWSTLSKLMSET